MSERQKMKAAKSKLDPKMTTALLDRITHHCEILENRQRFLPLQAAEKIRQISLINWKDLDADTWKLLDAD